MGVAVDGVGVAVGGVVFRLMAKLPLSVTKPNCRLSLTVKRPNDFANKMFFK